MIITKIQGGLGNQMFQYAVGQRLAEQRGEPLFIDTSYSFFVRHRPYVLDVFGVEAEKVSPLQIPFLYPINIPLNEERWKNVYTKFHLPGPRVVEEKEQYTYDPSFYQQTGDIFLLGFWQHQRYLAGMERELQRMFQFTSKIPRKFQRKLKVISGPKSVAVHIRRGDYLRSSGFAACTVKYYRQAFDFMHQKLKTPHFVFFSDDIEWAKKQFSDLPRAIFIDEADRPDTVDLQLMQCCRHHIIANSTFSWWGARLAERKGHLVVMPKKWSNHHPHASAAFKLPTWIQMNSK